VLVYYIGKRLFGRLSGALGLVILLGLLGPLQFDWVARRLLSENIYFWLLPASALALIALSDLSSRERRRSIPLAILGGVLLGLCCVTRGPTLLWVPPALVAVYAVRRRKATTGSAIVGQGIAGAAAAPSPPPSLRGRGDLTAPSALASPRKRGVDWAVVVATLACAAVVLLVPVRNYVVSGQASLVATNGMSTIELAHPLTPAVNLVGVEKNPVYRSLKLDESVIQLVEFVRQDPKGYIDTLVPLGLYALGLPGMLEPGSLIRWELVGLVALYLVYLALNLPERPRSLSSWLASPGLVLHSFIVLHFLVMMIFLPNVYGYRQVLPMYVFLAVFGGHVFALAAFRIARIFGREPQQYRRHDRERRAVEQYVPRTGAATSHE
jgi:hypothetical protein